MRTVQTGPAIGLVGQVALLGMLAGTVGLDAAGWVAGVGFGLTTTALLAHGLRRSGARGLGAANRVTLLRATLVGGVAALVADSFRTPAPVPTLVGLATVALMLDAVDGRVARRTGTATPLGARFDMEVDAFLILVLSAYVAVHMGPWVLAIGLMRYVFVAASWRFRWMNAPLPGSYARKVVAAVQGIFLVVAASGLLPYAGVLVGLALASLVWSFGRDVLWLWNNAAVSVGQSRHV